MGNAAPIESREENSFENLEDGAPAATSRVEDSVTSKKMIAKREYADAMSVEMGGERQHLVQSNSGQGDSAEGDSGMVYSELAHSSPAHSSPAHSSPAQAGSVLGDDEFFIHLEFFHGPMDLLLHLVARQEVSIEEVQMSLLAEQYLQIVMRAADRIDLERAGEYLVIASTLLAIKSRALLPAEVEQDTEERGDWDEANAFFEDLRSRLKAYHETQQRAGLLRKLPQLDVDTFARRDRKLLNPTPEMLQEPEDAFSLGALFASLMKRIGAASSFRITAEPFAVVDFMVSIVDSLALRRKDVTARQLNFGKLLQLLRGSSRKGTNRTVVIGGFIAVLELMKRGLVSATVSDTEHFNISLSMDSFDSSDSLSFSSEFDESPSQISDTEFSDTETSELDFRETEFGDTTGLGIIALGDSEIEGNEVGGAGELSDELRTVDRARVIQIDQYRAVHRAESGIADAQGPSGENDQAVNEDFEESRKEINH